MARQGGGKPPPRGRGRGPTGARGQTPTPGRGREGTSSPSSRGGGPQRRGQGAPAPVPGGGKTARKMEGNPPGKPYFPPRWSFKPPPGVCPTPLVGGYSLFNASFTPILFVFGLFFPRSAAPPATQVRPKPGRGPGPQRPEGNDGGSPPPPGKPGGPEAAWLPAEGTRGGDPPGETSEATHETHPRNRDRPSKPGAPGPPGSRGETPGEADSRAEANTPGRGVRGRARAHPRGDAVRRPPVRCPFGAQPQSSPRRSSHAAFPTSGVPALAGKHHGGTGGYAQGGPGCGGSRRMGAWGGGGARGALGGAPRHTPGR